MGRLPLPLQGNPRRLFFFFFFFNLSKPALAQVHRADIAGRKNTHRRFFRLYELVIERRVRERNGVVLLLRVKRPCPDRLALRLVVAVRRFFSENDLMGAVEINGLGPVKRRQGPTLLDIIPTRDQRPRRPASILGRQNIVHAEDDGGHKNERQGHPLQNGSQPTDMRGLKHCPGHQKFSGSAWVLVRSSHGRASARVTAYATTSWMNKETRAVALWFRATARPPGRSLRVGDRSRRAARSSLPPRTGRRTGPRRPSRRDPWPSAEITTNVQLGGLQIELSMGSCVVIFAAHAACVRVHV